MEKPLEVLEILLDFINVVDRSLYCRFQVESCDRMRTRDLDDWPVVALYLALDCPLWTEDSDFFGSGVATWTTDRVHLFLKS